MFSLLMFVADKQKYRRISHNQRTLHDCGRKGQMSRVCCRKNWFSWEWTKRAHRVNSPDQGPKRPVSTKTAQTKTAHSIYKTAPTDVNGLPKRP